MKLKARINGKDYDIVQGATFVDNFNETLDSATIVLDHVYKIDGIRQYDDVFIWNADEEFVGYGNLGDIIELDHLVKVSGKETGSGSWSEPITLNGQRGMTIKDMGAYFELSGPICQIWAYYFYQFTNSTDDRCRYNRPTMSIAAGLSSKGRSWTETGLAISEINDSRHGRIDSEIVLKNGNVALKCVYSPEDETFSIAKNQEIEGEFFLVRWLEYAGGSYETNDISKIFELSIDLEDFSDKGIEDFDISLSYRGIGYDFAMKDIQEPDTDHRIVTFGNPKLGEVAFLFVRTGHTGHPTKDSEEWITEGLGNKYPLIIDTSGIFGEVDNITVLSLTGIQDGTKPKPSFYKHLLFDKFPEEQVGLETGLYKCTIDLFSETKKLEKIILPNISITQSLVQEKKRTCWFYMKKYVEAFSPKYKKVSNKDRHTWKYVRKYSLSESGIDQNGVIANLKDVFDSVICPEMSLTNPSLKDLLAQIMIVKDMIPIVRDDVIYALDIGNTTGDFNRTNVNFVGGTLNSDDFATDARREHSNALSQENSAHMVEYLGFRTPNSTFLTLDQLILETRFPIYKINSIKMCYYKRATLMPPNGSQLPIKYKIFLCKQDITPLILQNTVRNTLSTNWQSFRDKEHPTGVHDFSDIDYSDVTTPNTGLNYAKQFKLCTIGYDIGSNRLEGWGEKYEYLDFLWFKNECTYIENIVNLVDAINCYGELSKFQIKGAEEGYESVVVDPGITSIIDFEGESNNIANQIKSIVFEVDYDAMYNGAIMHGKENIDRDDIVTADNCNSALTILEADGLYEREKMDRIGNKVFRMTARYDKDNGGSNPNRVQNVGTYDEETDSIIYSREYQIYDNAILANYESTHEYVLKNYFTTVWAKYRTYSLMSYGESIRRAENVRKFLLLSKDKAYYENKGDKDDLLFGGIDTAKGFLSFVTPTIIDDMGLIKHDERLNCGYFILYTGENSYDNTGMYLSDINTFASGTSLCFNIATYDNISGGNYIDALSANLELDMDPNEEEEVQKALDYKTTQKWWNMIGSVDDAFVEDIGFYVCHLNESEYFHDYMFPDDDPDRVARIKRRYMNLPKVFDEGLFISNINSKIGVERRAICKDNKEIIDMTMQFDYLAKNDGTMAFSPWICKLNDFIGHYDKFDADGEIITDAVGGVSARLFAYDAEIWVTPLLKAKHLGHIVLKLSDSALNSLRVGSRFVNSNIPVSFQIEGIYDSQVIHTNGKYRANGNGVFIMNSVTSIGANGITVACSFSGSFSCTSYRTDLFHWEPYDEETTGGSNNELETLTFTQVARQTEGGETFNYFEADVPTSMMTCMPCQNDPKASMGFQGITTYYLSHKDGSDDPTALNSGDSIVVDCSATSNLIETKPIKKNMFIVVSSSKVDRKLEYSQYRYDMDANPQINTFPSGMFVDAEALVSETFVVFKDDSGLVGMTVDPSYYNGAQDIPITVRSIQYYYRDNSTGLMRFVFGVNLPETFQGNVSYEPFNIYLSAISKRRMDVYDENHNVVGTVRNALTDLAEGFDEQRYDPVRAIPPAYREAKYLESDGRQGITAQIGFNEASSFECDFMAYDEESDGEIFGGSDGLNGFFVRCSMDQSDARPSIRIELDSNQTSGKSQYVAISPNERHTIKTSPVVFSIDGTNAGFVFPPPLNGIGSFVGMGVFAAKYHDGTLGHGLIGRIYGFKAYSGSELTHDLVPCVRLSDNEPGMYDTMTGQFHANAGTGEFKVRF